ncbi:hypothetical protein Pmani_039502 [Petrolisthes manimaculis]|uniref:Lipase maturation factor n=1 Tax=Petrolisthes manimaculis TaxID=1843537 RepID=A0AAE1NCL2_9EUCA|nr:hypothetical protein Pmani_039502 [Petrolisthes manimaculis]
MEEKARKKEGEEEEAITKEGKKEKAIKKKGEKEREEEEGEEEKEREKEEGEGEKEREKEEGEGEKENGGEEIIYDDKIIYPNTHWLTRIVYLRSLCLIYLIAFLIAYNQNKALIGDRGLLPLQLHLQAIVNVTKGSTVGGFVAAPTLLWLAEPWSEINVWLDNIAVFGLSLAVTVCVLGSSNMFIMFTLWGLYFSIVSVGQVWYAFGWESLLLESGLLALWGVPLLSLSPLPPHSPPTPVMVWGGRWLGVRLALGSGLAKLRGDWCWWSLTCMCYHYETQPLPNPISYYLHQLPTIIHILLTLGSHIVELLLPLLSFMSRDLRMLFATSQIILQLITVLTGNVSFLNWLTIAISLLYFDDKAYAKIFSLQSQKEILRLQKLARENSPLVDPGNVRHTCNKMITIMITVLSLPVIINLLFASPVINTSFEPFRIVNTYGALGSVNRERTDVVLEGTHSRDPKDSSSTVWLEYEFKCKPSRPRQTPCFISPYHHRLDWLMWFAGLQSFEQHPWLLHLAGKLLINDEEATTLLEHNPFINTKPPLFIRATKYNYKFATTTTTTTTTTTGRGGGGGGEDCVANVGEMVPPQCCQGRPCNTSTTPVLQKSRKYDLVV